MEYFLFIWSVATFIEKRLKTGISYEELEEATGYSYRHIRETFRQCTKIPLAKYIISRKIANAAFEMVHTNISIMDIAVEYGFDSYDPFTRAFKRETGITPTEFRKRGCIVGRRKLVAGAFAPAILKDGNKQLLSSDITEVYNVMKSNDKTDRSCILLGVPKVQYSYEECTPFPSCLKTCLNYMGQNIDYSYLMAASGAAFRLRWNTRFWDGGNVDIMCIYEDQYEVFKKSFQAAGRTYNILRREDADKESFKTFIKSEIDVGRPVIALGIIGPPEACIITGYEDNGQKLLGWNFFQNNPEFSKDTGIHETGYFVCDKWWENRNTLALISIGEDIKELVCLKDIVSNAIDIMTKSKVTFEKRYDNRSEEYAGGQNAYDAWVRAISNDNEFPENAILPILFERAMCQTDAQVMVGEGRFYAATFIEWVGRTNEIVAQECNIAAAYFRAAAQCALRMNEPKGGFEQNETTVRKFAEPNVRRKIASLILEAKLNEAKACELLNIILSKLEKVCDL